MSFVPLPSEKPRFPTARDFAENFRKMARAFRDKCEKNEEAVQPPGYVIEHLERR